MEVFRVAWRERWEDSWERIWGDFGVLGGLVRASWGPFEGILHACAGILEGSGFKIDVEHLHGQFPLSGRAVLKASWGRFCGSCKIVLDLILRLFRGPSAQQTGHAKSTFSLHSEFFGMIF